MGVGSRQVVRIQREWFVVHGTNPQHIISKAYFDKEEAEAALDQGDCWCGPRPIKETNVAKILYGREHPAVLAARPIVDHVLGRSEGARDGLADEADQYVAQALEDYLDQQVVDRLRELVEAFARGECLE